jgi:hypothetical protein
MIILMKQTIVQKMIDLNKVLKDLHWALWCAQKAKACIRLLSYICFHKSVHKSKIHILKDFKKIIW